MVTHGYLGMNNSARWYESEQKYRRLVENARFGVLIYDMDCIHYVNPYMLETLGYSPEDFDLRHLNVWNLFTSPCRQRLYPVFLKRSTYKESFSDRLVAEILTQDGQIKIFEMATSSIQYNRQYAFQSNLADITERIQAQGLLVKHMTQHRQSEQRFRHLMENLSDGFILVDTGLNILQVNPALEAMLESESMQLLNRSLLNLCYSSRDQIALLQGITRRRACSKDRYEICFRSCSGRAISTLITPTPYLNENGQVVGSFAVVKDLTELKLTQARVAYQAELLNRISEGIIVTDVNGSISYWNRSVEQMFGLDRLCLSPDEARLFLQQQWDDLSPGFRGDPISCHEFEYEHPDGSTCYLRLSSVPILQPATGLGIITVVSELTELIRSRREAETASEAKSNFLANVSHDIRTPLIGILGASDLLSQESLTPYQQDLISTLQQCGEQLLGLINDILDLSRIEAGYSVSVEREFNINQLLHECMQMIHPRVDSGQVHMYADIDPTIPPRLIADPMQVRRVLLNLLSNAAKYTSWGYIAVRVKANRFSPLDESHHLWLEFSVEDSGIGIPENKLAQVFEAFHRVNQENRDGTGLGLTISRELVQLMGGTIRATSSPGRGSVFSFVIPVKVPAEAAAPPQSTDLSATRSAPSLYHRVLIVEDNHVNLRILSYMLKKQGFIVYESRNGQECLSMLDHKTIDLIMMDMQMPVLNGYETVRRIRAKPQFQDLPIIALTAFAMEGDAVKCLQAGCNDYLSKPISSERLRKALAPYLPFPSLSPVKSRDLALLTEQLMPEYVAVLAADLATMRTALGENDRELIVSIAHDIKGTAGLYGLTRLSQLAEEIYRLAKQSLSGDISSLLYQAERLVDNIKTSSHLEVSDP